MEGGAKRVTFVESFSDSCNTNPPRFRISRVSIACVTKNISCELVLQSLRHFGTGKVVEYLYTK